MVGVDSLVTTLALGILPLLLARMVWRWRNRKFLELAAKVPGQPTLPLLGNALVFMAKPNEQLKILQDLILTYGEYVRFWLGPELNILLTNPDDIKLTLTSNKVNQKGPLYKYIETTAGPGILTGGNGWRNHRKIVTPSYNKKSVASFARVFNMEAANLAEQLCCKEPGKTFNVYVDVVNSTTQCVCQTLMGLTKIESQNLPNLEYIISKTKRMYNLIFARITKWWLQIPIVYWLLGYRKEEDEMKYKFFNIMKDIIKLRRKALERNESVSEDARGIVDRFILSGELTEQEIEQETLTLFTTSQEAAAKIASAVFVFLGHLPHWQDKVYTEIQERLGTEDDFITEEQIKSLLYLDMVYKEVLRWMSIAAMVQRTVEEDITIDNGNLTLPAGTSLVIPIHILHRNPKYWENPDVVDPARFMPENVKYRNPNAFVPYSLGPMDCLGRVYAINMIKTLVVRVLRHVRFEADGRLEDLSLDVAISVSFTDGYNVRAYPRKPKIAKVSRAA